MRRRHHRLPTCPAWCFSCGERVVAGMTFDGFVRCDVCYLELAFGIVMPQNFPTAGPTGNVSPGPWRDDDNPAQQNGVREWEEV